MGQATILTNGWGERSRPESGEGALPATLLRVVDYGLVGIICVAPFFFGGRHDLGRLVLVTLVAATAVAWFLYQATQRAAAWPRTWAYVVLALSCALVLVQILPLRPEWVAAVSPSIGRLLPVWAGTGEGAALGSWQTLSLTPHETAKSLAMLVSYVLLFVVVAGRIRSTADVERIQRWIGAAAVGVAAFGVLQYFTSGSLYFWFFAHPFRSAADDLSGPFINRNHFAHFLVLGIGPLVAWMLQLLPARGSGVAKQQSQLPAAQRVVACAVAAALALVCFAVIGSRSRGGAIVMLTSGGVMTVIYLYRRVVDSRFLYGLVGLAAAVVAMLSLYGYDKVAGRLDDLADFSVEEMDRSGARRVIWAANIAAAKAFPMLGTGAGSHREIAAAFLPESSTKSFSHAENGYLQVATENGAAGVVLLLTGMAVVGGWCVRCFRTARSSYEARLYGAVAAGLAASAIHSLFDFVWYIPACMSITVVLAACAFRLSQLADGDRLPTSRAPVLARGRWLELAAAALLVGGWSVHTFVGPAGAAVHWDRYRRASVADGKLAQESIEQFIAGGSIPSQDARRLLSQSMLRHLQAVVRWDPHFAEAHVRLADRLLNEFEFHARQGPNAMHVEHIRATAQKSRFSSADQLDEWLLRAFGPQAQVLRQALAHAQQATALSPLQADAYMHLANLAFLQLAPGEVQERYIDQALRIRRYDRNILSEAGKRAVAAGQLDAALEHWKNCFHTPGRHQQEIVYLLVAAGMPAREFIACFKPDWQTLRLVWAQYRKENALHELEALVAYAAEQAEVETATAGDTASAYIWLWQAGFYSDLKRNEEALACLERAYARNPRRYAVRAALARELQRAGRLAEAEPHVRWCLARRPAEKSMSAALVAISKARFAQRETTVAFGSGDSRSLTAPVSESVPATNAATQ